MDRIGDFITRIRNAGQAGHTSVAVPRTRVLMAIARLLEREGYLGRIEEKDVAGVPHVVVGIVYRDGKPAVQGGKRVSKLSGRVYKGSRDITPVRHGYGVAVLSTPQGILTGREAQEANVGGEVLFEMW